MPRRLMQRNEEPYSQKESDFVTGADILRANAHHKYIWVVSDAGKRELITEKKLEDRKKDAARKREERAKTDELTSPGKSSSSKTKTKVNDP